MNAPQEISGESLRLLNRANLKDIEKQVIAMGQSGLSCSEALAFAFAPLIGLDKDMAMRMVCGFAGGMGLSGETCGIVSTALLVVGFHYSSETSTAHENRRMVMMHSMEFVDRFEEENGSLVCRDLCHLEVDLRSPEGAAAIRQRGRVEQLLASGARILLNILE
ncbi:C-GCAxxG-C-C family protein [Desulfovibrio inopinatus]|uniref:C-GCAxxG-C-C family protein n=1 Tax=Desulfovibrio inopinatus TaxID=102109 RepID=UPI0004144036|nr:C-GCAxxG-C-C family protein [Desulfovibrio inopinatus]